MSIVEFVAEPEGRVLFVAEGRVPFVVVLPSIPPVATVLFVSVPFGTVLVSITDIVSFASHEMRAKKGTADAVWLRAIPSVKLTSTPCTEPN